MTGQDILAAKDLAFVNENVPEWGGDVRLHQLSARRMMEMTEAMNVSPKDGLFIIFIYTATDLADALLFPLSDDAEVRKVQLAEYVTGLREKSMAVLNRLQYAAMRVNQMGPRKTTDDVIKNA